MSLKDVIEIFIGRRKFFLVEIAISFVLSLALAFLFGGRYYESESFIKARVRPNIFSYFKNFITSERSFSVLSNSLISMCEKEELSYRDFLDMVSFERVPVKLRKEEEFISGFKLKVRMKDPNYAYKTASFLSEKSLSVISAMSFNVWLDRTMATNSVILKTISASNYILRSEIRGLTRKLERLRKIERIYGDKGLTKVLSVEEGGDKFLPLRVQIVGVESSIADKESLLDSLNLTASNLIQRLNVLKDLKNKIYNGEMSPDRILNFPSSLSNVVSGIKGDREFLNVILKQAERFKDELFIVREPNIPKWAKPSRSLIFVVSFVILFIFSLIGVFIYDSLSKAKGDLKSR